MNTQVRTRSRASAPAEGSPAARGARNDGPADPRQSGQSGESGRGGQRVTAGQRAAPAGQRAAPGGLRAAPAGQRAAPHAGPRAAPAGGQRAAPAGQRAVRLGGPRTAGPAGRSDLRPAALPEVAGRLPVARTPFILLVLGLLGGGLVCLLVINTTLATTTFQISNLQQQNIKLSQQEQVLQGQVASEQSPAKIAREARDLGMRPQANLRFLNARTGRMYGTAATVPGVTAVPAGYVP